MRAEPQLRVRVVGDEIVVTLPGYHYAVTLQAFAGNRAYREE